MKDKKILIFGDVGIDEYVWGEVRRISPEAPVPVVEVNQSQTKLGLSGNVAANVASLGGIPLLFSMVGQDSKAQALRELLQERGISTDYLMEDPHRETTTKLRIMSGQHHVVRVDYENKTPLLPETLAPFKEVLEEQIKAAHGVIIQDYGKGQIVEHSCQWVIQTAGQYGKPLIVDPYSSTPLSYYRGAQLMTPNRDEALELAKQIPQPSLWENVDQVGKALMEQIGASQMVITLGAQGLKIFDGSGISHLPTFAQKVFDVTGAGDTVIATFALGMAAGWKIEETAFLANKAAGVVVGSVGAVACGLEELQRSLTAG